MKWVFRINQCLTKDAAGLSGSDGDDWWSFIEINILASGEVISQKSKCKYHYTFTSEETDETRLMLIETLLSKGLERFIGKPFKTSDKFNVGEVAS